ncbi:hypothetical protein CHU95_09300 [Niveispirillum lacus]|uniref:Copper-binding protein n=1 Tax=Niveispirillum lacus TaxID=1981099 RepID=A0A255YZV1_9PROT|nr:hypothetical protein [Niveispirillum lacus]OYQ34783.1 hypothetical protein CHU95_09300 [Niveispirillum lacus]
MVMKHPMFRLALVAALTLSPLTVLAHGDTTPKHGGIVQMTGETLIELVAGADLASLYVREDDEPIVSAEFTATMTIMEAAGKRQVDLTPAAGNRFDAPGVRLTRGAKVAVMVINKASQARSILSFVIK